MNTKPSLVTLGLRVLLIAGSLCCGTAYAQGWPVRPVRIVVATGAGGTADTVARLLALKLAETFKQNFMVENRPGGGNLIGCELVVKSPPDGYTLLVVGGTTHTVMPTMTKNFPYDPVRDLTHIALLGGPPSVLIVHPSLPARDFKEFIALARAQPGKLSYGSPGNGTTGHLTAEHFKHVAGIDMAHVPYKGEPQGITDLVGGRVQVMWATPTTGLAHVRDGKLRAVATNLKARSRLLPDAPTMAEVGIPQYSVTSWAALFGPANLPRELVARLNKEFTDAMKRSDVIAAMDKQAFPMNPSTPEELGAFVKSQMESYRTILRAAGVQPE